MLTSIHDRNHDAFPIPARSYLLPAQGIGIRIRPVGIRVVGDVADRADLVVCCVVTTACAEAGGVVGQIALDALASALASALGRIVIETPRKSSWSAKEVNESELET